MIASAAPRRVTSISAAKHSVSFIPEDVPVFAAIEAAHVFAAIEAAHMFTTIEAAHVFGMIEAAHVFGMVPAARVFATTVFEATVESALMPTKAALMPGEPT
jgi:hypothetical protein